MTDKKVPLDDILRITAHETYLEITVARYAIIALQKEAERLELAVKLINSQIEKEQENINSKEQLFKNTITKLRDVYDIPDDWLIDTKTGEIKPPENQRQ